MHGMRCFFKTYTEGHFGIAVRVFVKQKGGDSIRGVWYGSESGFVTLVSRSTRHETNYDGDSGFNLYYLEGLSLR